MCPSFNTKSYQPAVKPSLIQPSHIRRSDRLKSVNTFVYSYSSDDDCLVDQDVVADNLDTIDSVGTASPPSEALMPAMIASDDEFRDPEVTTNLVLASEEPQAEVARPNTVLNTPSTQPDVSSSTKGKSPDRTGTK